MRTTLFFTALALSIVPGNAPAQNATNAPPARTQSGFAVDRLARIDQFLQRYVDNNEIAGAVLRVLRDGRPVYERAVGWADKESGRRMTTDAIFRIASQSKAITTTAILVLVEEGRISLGDPVSRFIPQFAHTTVATTSDTGRVIAKAKREITIRDLLTHTAGISYGTDSIVAPLYASKGLGPTAGWNEPICTTMERLATLPFVAQPGEKWVYGYNIDILGCVVERASGIPLDQFIRTRITQPLGMNDTFFFVPPEKKQRLVTVYMSDSTGHVRRAPDGPRGQGNYVEGPRRSFAGGAGLLSTASDYSRFLQMLLNGGQLDGVRILSPNTVGLMTTNQVGSLFDERSGSGFSLGFATVERLGADGLAPVGAYGWGGAYGSGYQVDPKDGLIIVFMINQLPNSADIGGKVRTLVYQALVQPTM